MYRMSRRLPGLSRTSVHSFPLTNSPTLSIRRNLSISLSNWAERPPPWRITDKLVPYWTKRLSLGQVDDSSANHGHTLFTSPEATKDDVVRKAPNLENPTEAGNAAVIFASPRHASWLTDADFMGLLLQKLFVGKPGTRKRLGPKQPKQKINILAAVVDGLHPKGSSMEMQEGLSIQFGSLDCLLPGLWDEAPMETPEVYSHSVEPGFESAHVSVSLRKNAYQRELCTVTIPLANTLFHNGRRTTLLASEWVFDPSGQDNITLSRTTEKRSQKIDLPMPSRTTKKQTQRTGLNKPIAEPHATDQKIKMGCPLVPITHPRKIVEALGNILAKVEINGEPAPASKELQVNIPILLQARQKQSNDDPKSARIGVWALVIPESLVVDHGSLQTSLEATKTSSLKYDDKLRMARLDTAVDKLAFEMETTAECTVWQRYNIIYDVLRQGGRLHQILSGGGEWGAKASLLSLDPQSSYGAECEEDELDRFQRSFHGEDTAAGAITRPGDFVQFFVEGNPVMHGGPMAVADAVDSYPFRSFGVGEFNKEKNGSEIDGHSLQNPRHLVQLAPCHFGAFSAEGLYLDSTGGVNSTKTKINTPGTIIWTALSGAGAQDVEDLRKSVGHGGLYHLKRFRETNRRLELK